MINLSHPRPRFRAQSFASLSMDSREPPEPRTRRGVKAKEAADKAKEQRILDEFPGVLMVGRNEEVRPSNADKEHDERRQLDAIERGDMVIKEEVEEEDGSQDEEKGRELEELQGEKVGVGEGDVSIKDEVTESEEERMLEESTSGNNLLTDGQTVAIIMDFLHELEVKEERQDEEIHLPMSGGHGPVLFPGGRAGEGEGTEQDPVLFESEESKGEDEEEGEDTDVDWVEEQEESDQTMNEEGGQNVAKHDGIGSVLIDRGEGESAPEDEEAQGVMDVDGKGGEGAGGQGGLFQGKILNWVMGGTGLDILFILLLHNIQSCHENRHCAGMIVSL